MTVIPVGFTYATYGALTITAVTYLEYLNIIKHQIFMVNWISINYIRCNTFKHFG